MIYCNDVTRCDALYVYTSLYISVVKLAFGRNLEFPNTVGPFMMVKAPQFPRLFNDFFRLPQAEKPDPKSETSFMVGLQPCDIGLQEGDFLCQASK